MARADRFEAVVICTGNRARSPIAEAVLRRLADGLPLTVTSVGTLELGAVPALPEALEAAAALGIDLSGHRARWLGDTRLDDADLVLGFERRHVASAVVDHGAARARTFTLPELVELLRGAQALPETDPVERARKLVADAHAARSQRGPAAPAEIADPLGRTSAVFAATARETSDLTEELVALLFGLRAPVATRG